MQTEIKNLEKLVLVSLDIDIWSGQAKLQASDLKRISVEDLPPERLASLGSKRLCNKEHLKVFAKLKTRATRAVLEYGRPFLGGYAYPRDRAQELEGRLIIIEQEYLEAKRQFLNRYDQAVEDWINENPEYAEAIRAGALTRAEVGERLNFGFQIINIQPTESAEAQTRLKKSVQGVGDALVDEIAERANEFFEKYLVGAEQISTQTKRTLKNMRDKVSGMAFLNGNLLPMEQLLDEMLRGYAFHQGKKHVTGEEFNRILAATLILSDRKKLERYTSGELSLEKLLSSMSGAKKEEAVESKAEPVEKSVKTPEPSENTASNAADEEDYFF
ncbi:uncharacterized protein DUF3150 [Marinobacter nauticus]|jgi:hypothetical protein|uniref:Uncharacterized protein DUF3150 n=1 Tax=Marinobacter nauticus TaxID=2743 RepID=A0A368X7N7_MARNT|nr:DUF3150 domain-containing protein [Marinobacter nauticus]RCW64010.1 uncharacterized protein DUF3150 [Marinobacter nauticus]